MAARGMRDGIPIPPMDSGRCAHCFWMGSSTWRSSIFVMTPKIMTRNCCNLSPFSLLIKSRGSSDTLRPGDALQRPCTPVQ